MEEEFDIGEYIPHTGVTLGFSTKSNVWRSRYGFLPTCYSTVDNIMLSHLKPSNPNSVTGNNPHGYTTDIITWNHEYQEGEETLDNLNTFYDVAFQSSVEVVSNQNPSAVKIFKAMSIEGDGMWNATAYTNVPRGGVAEQQTNMFMFQEREGNLYSDIPTANTSQDASRDLMFIGFVRAEDFYADETNVESINDGFAQIWTLPLVSIPQVSLPTSDDTALFFGRRLVQEAELELLEDDPDYMVNLFPTQFQSVRRVLPITNPAHATPVVYTEHSAARLRPRGYDSETNSIQIFAGIDDSIALEGGVEFGKGLQYFVQQFLDDPQEGLTRFPEDYIPVYVSQSVYKTGEMLRGPYMGVTIEGSGEIFAINVDFENIKLDSSLG